MESTEHLRVETTAKAVGWVVMDRSERYNALTDGMATALADAVEALADDEAVRCLVLTGADGVFNTGADLATFAGDSSDVDRIDAIATQLHRTIRTMVDAPKPVVVGVNGVVAGGGLGLALAGDVVLASEDARFEYAYPKLGLSGDGGATWFLPRLLGLRRAQAFALLDEPIGPNEAVEMGLVTEVAAPDEFEDRLEDLASDLASGPTLAYAEIKTLLREGAINTLESHLDLEKDRITALAETDDYVAGLRSFLEKEPSEFEGR